MHLRIQLKQGAVSSPSVSHPSVLGNPCTTQDRVYYFSPLFHTVTPHYNSCRSACKNQYWESPMHLRNPLILLLGGNNYPPRQDTKHLCFNNRSLSYLGYILCIHFLPVISTRCFLNKLNGNATILISVGIYPSHSGDLQIYAPLLLSSCCWFY